MKKKAHINEGLLPRRQVMRPVRFYGTGVTVMGLGLHGGGVAVVRWLVGQGARVTVTDLRSAAVLRSSLRQIAGLPVKTVLGMHRREDFINADFVIKNPGVPSDSPFLKIARQRRVPIETDLSLFVRLCRSRIVVGITGTKGKSTTATLVHHILNVAGRRPVLAGNIRISPLPMLPRITATTPVVLELSSWQLEDMQHLGYSPPIAVITNIFPDHLNRYSSMQSYARSKELILKFQGRSGTAVLNADDQRVFRMRRLTPGTAVFFGAKNVSHKNGIFLDHGMIVDSTRGRKTAVCRLTDVPLRGEHNVMNVLAAVAAARVLRIPTKVITRGIKSFHGIPGRLELIRRWQGINFYNDTTATAPVASVAALDSFDKPVVLIAGGADKRLLYAAFARAINRKVTSLILLPGKATERLVQELRKINFTRYQRSRSMAAAVRQAVAADRQAYPILLSPGAASFGLFLNEFDRGDQFIKSVKKL